MPINISMVSFEFVIFYRFFIIFFLGIAFNTEYMKLLFYFT